MPLLTFRFAFMFSNSLKCMFLKRSQLAYFQVWKKHIFDICIISVSFGGLVSLSGIYFFLHISNPCNEFNLFFHIYAWYSAMNRGRSELNTFSLARCHFHPRFHLDQKNCPSVLSRCLEAPNSTLLWKTSADLPRRLQVLPSTLKKCPNLKITPRYIYSHPTLCSPGRESTAKLCHVPA